MSSTQAGPSKWQILNLPSSPTPPQPNILNNEENVQLWQSTPGFKAFWSWIQRRCESIKGKEILRGPYKGDNPCLKALMEMLEKMNLWVEEVPLQVQSNQRFGNLAFREYVRLVNERIPTILKEGNPPDHLLEQILPLLIESTPFGQPIRLDYGTGHELAFVLALWFCVLSGWVKSKSSGIPLELSGEERKSEEEEKEQEQEQESLEDELILRVFTKYLDLMTLLQKRYRLEPAGSHGVWGLDDYCLLPYLFGSAQQLGSNFTPTQSLQLATSPSSSPLSQIKDLYTLSLYHLTLFKKGAAFSEHSPLLYSLSEKPDWKKVHGGLRKMFLGEVVGKRVVVQGLWIGGWGWGGDVPSTEGRGKGVMSRTGSYGNGGNRGGREEDQIGSGAITKAPWAV